MTNEVKNWNKSSMFTFPRSISEAGVSGRKMPPNVSTMAGTPARANEIRHPHGCKIRSPHIIYCQLIEIQDLLLYEVLFSDQLNSIYKSCLLDDRTLSWMRVLWKSNHLGSYKTPRWESQISSLTRLSNARLLSWYICEWQWFICVLLCIAITAVQACGLALWIKTLQDSVPVDTLNQSSPISDHFVKFHQTEWSIIIEMAMKAHIDVLSP